MNDYDFVKLNKEQFRDQIDFCTKLMKNKKLEELDLESFLKSIHNYKKPINQHSVFFIDNGNNNK